jgi:hypothetical protein
MTSLPVIAVWLVLWASLMRALLVRAEILPRVCARCARPLERHELGASVCRCRR